MTAGTVHFVVEGGFLTDTARRLWNEEGEPEKAMNILECLHDEKGGITKDQMMAVLEGRLKLVGDSDKGIGLEPDTYKGLTLKQVMARMRKRTEEAEEDLKDLTQIHLGDTVTVGSPTGARIVPRRRTMKTAVTGRTVLDDDVDFDDLIDDPARVLPKTGKKPTKRLRIYKRDDDMGKRMVAASRSAEIRKKEEAEERELEKRGIAARAQARREVEAASQDSITTDTGWLSPEGRFYPCGYAQHARTAWALGHTGSPTNHMVEIDGWIRMSMSDETQNFFSSGYERGNFTDKQVELVKAYCERTGQKLPFWLQEREP